MAVPAAPTESGGSKVFFITYDNAGTNAAAVVRAYRTGTVNGTVLGAMGVYPVSGAIGHGYKAMTAGARTQITSTSTPCQGVLLKANEDNTAAVYVGGSTVTADTTASTGGFPLQPGEKQSFPCSDANQIYIIGSGTDGVHWVANKD